MVNSFKAGDIVQLKSGGPAMTVESVDDKGAWTTWFAGAKRERSHFSFHVLQAVPEQSAKK